jgi:transcriptional regulator with XRE-family HTH domain
MKQLGEKIRFYRQQKQVSRFKLAHEANLSPITLYRIEHGKCIPKLSTIIRIEKALQLPENSLFLSASESDQQVIHCSLSKTKVLNQNELILTLHLHLTEP